MLLDINKIQVDVGGFWHVCIFLGVAFCLLSIIGSHFRRLHPVALAFWAYVLGWSLFLVEWPHALYGDATRSFKATAGETLVEVIVLPIFLLVSDRKWLWNIIPFAVTFTLTCVWLKLPGLLNAPSFNLAFAALCLPFVPVWLALATVVSVACHHAGTAQLIIASQIAALGFLSIKGPIRKQIEKLSYGSAVLVGVACGLGIVACVALAFHHAQGPLLMGNGRVHMWMPLLQKWAEQWESIVLGFGPGSYVWLNLARGWHYKTSNAIFLQGHSDVLQIPFELGLAGFALAIGTVYVAVKNVIARPRWLAATLGAIAFCMTYHPFRYFPSALMMALIFREGLVRGKHSA